MDESSAVWNSSKRTLTASTIVKIWDRASAKEIQRIPVDTANNQALTYSPDGTVLAIAPFNSAIRLYDIKTGHQVQLQNTQEGDVHAIAFSPSGDLLAATVDDRRTQLWDAHTGEALATLLSLNDGKDWLVAMPNGLFDGSPAAWSQILWRFSEDTFDVAPVELFFNDFYRPGLLADLAAGVRPKPAQQIADKDRRQPKLKLSTATGNSIVKTRAVSVKVSIGEAPAGAQDLRLFRNGSLVKVWHGDVLKGQSAATLEATIPLIAGENRLTAYAFNRDNIKSSDATLVLSRTAGNERRGVAYILTVGIDKYANPDYNLRYAAADARDFGEELKRQQEKLARYERVEVMPLFDEQATKAAILAALDRLAAIAQPEDTVFLYYAGHGTAQGSRYYLIPHDLGYQGRRAESS